MFSFVALLVICLEKWPQVQRNYGISWWCNGKCSVQLTKKDDYMQLYTFLSVQMIQDFSHLILPHQCFLILHGSLTFCKQSNAINKAFSFEPMSRLLSAEEYHNNIWCRTDKQVWFSRLKDISNIQMRWSLFTSVSHPSALTHTHTYHHFGTNDSLNNWVVIT